MTEAGDATWGILMHVRPPWALWPACCAWAGLLPATVGQLRTACKRIRNTLRQWSGSGRAGPQVPANADTTGPSASQLSDSIDQ